MKPRKIVYPLFFVIIILMIVIPSNTIPKAHAPSGINFINKVDAQTNAGTTLNAALSITSGNAIVVEIQGIGAFNSFTTTDSQSNTYTKQVVSVTTNGAGASTYIYTAIAGSTTTDTITVATGGGARQYAFIALQYSGVNGFGKTATDQSDTASGISGSTTVTFSNTAGVSSWIVEDFFAVIGNTVTVTEASGQTVRDQPVVVNICGAGTPCLATDINAPGISFQLILSYTVSPASSCPCIFSHSALELLGTAIGTLNGVTNCIGNCGSPAVTLVNTNSTQTSFNFNQSITVFYEFQSNLNGFILNESVNVGKTYTNGQQVSLAMYTATCSTGVTPFSPTCPGQQRALGTSQPNVAKGKFTVTPQPVSINIGMWIAISFTASFSPVAINDTNTVVPMFFQAFATNPPTLFGQPLSASSCSCKMGLWAWIQGNVVIPLPPPLPANQNCGTDLLCTLNLAILGLTPTNPAVGAFILGIIWSVITIAGLEYFFWYVTKNDQGEGQLAVLPAGLYILIFMGWTTMMMLVVGALWYILLEALTVILLFSGYVGSLVSSRGRGRNTE